jgi:integrase
LKEILDSALRTSTIIAVNSRGAPWTESGFRASFFKLLRKLRADRKIGSGLTFHGLRHTVGKALAEAGCDARTIASVLGQQSEAAARIYADEEDRTKRASAAIRKLERRRPQNIPSTKNV